MKCPIVWYQDYDKGIYSGFKYGDCLKEECAVWDKANDQCSILSLVGLLDGIWTTLDDIKEKIPGERRLRK